MDGGKRVLSTDLIFPCPITMNRSTSSSTKSCQSYASADNSAPNMQQERCANASRLKDMNQITTDVRIEGVTTDIPGRFLIGDDSFQIATDATAGKGGRGQAAGTSHLIGGALVTCALNVFRGAIQPDLPDFRRVHIDARFQRLEGTANLGSLHLDVEIEGVNQAETDRLRQLDLTIVLSIRRCAATKHFRTGTGPRRAPAGRGADEHPPRRTGADPARRRAARPPARSDRLRWLLLLPPHPQPARGQGMDLLTRCRDRAPAGVLTRTRLPSTSRPM